MRCATCKVDYPVRGGVPWLFADPAFALIEWRNRFAHARLRREAELVRIREALERPQVGPARQRLERLAAGAEACIAELDDLLGPHLGRAAGPLASHVALRTRLPPGQGILTYEHNLFRDWCWGDVENAAGLDAVLAMPGVRSAQHVLVLGAGAGRLAWDLHAATAAAQTVALDLNPLLVYVADRMASGTTLALTEFPLAPREPEHVAVCRTLRAPAAGRSGYAAVLGDALQAPFVDAQFDLVLTPWLLDILDTPADALVHEINRLLVPGGTWVYHGSVAFAMSDPAECLTLPELLARSAALGFATGAVDEREMPYLCCPESRQRRREQVVTFAAVRESAAPAAAARAQASMLPDWITGDNRPIPALPGFQAQALATRTHAYIMSLIDGKRSRADIARVLAQHGLMDEAGARTALRGFLETMYEEARRAGGL